MALIEIWQNEPITGPAPSNGRHELLASPVIQNRALNLEMYVEYANPLPAFGAVAQSWRLYALIEKDLTSHWVPLVEQGSGWAGENQGNRRVFLVSTGVASDADGVEFWPTEDTREIRKYGRVEYDFRVKIFVEEWDAGGPGSFQSASVTCFGDTFGG